MDLGGIGGNAHKPRRPHGYLAVGEIGQRGDGATRGRNALPLDARGELRGRERRLKLRLRGERERDLSGGKVCGYVAIAQVDRLKGGARLLRLREGEQIILKRRLVKPDCLQRCRTENGEVAVRVGAGIHGKRRHGRRCRTIGDLEVVRVGTGETVLKSRRKDRGGGRLRGGDVRGGRRRTLTDETAGGGRGNRSIESRFASGIFIESGDGQLGNRPDVVRWTGIGRDDRRGDGRRSERAVGRLRFAGHCHILCDAENFSIRGEESRVDDEFLRCGAVRVIDRDCSLRFLRNLLDG